MLWITKTVCKLVLRPDFFCYYKIFPFYIPHKKLCFIEHSFIINVDGYYVPRPFSGINYLFVSIPRQACKEHEISLKNTAHKGNCWLRSKALWLFSQTRSKIHTHYQNTRSKFVFRRYIYIQGVRYFYRFLSIATFFYVTKTNNEILSALKIAVGFLHIYIIHCWTFWGPLNYVPIIILGIALFLNNTCDLTNW